MPKSQKMLLIVTFCLLVIAGFLVYRTYVKDDRSDASDISDSAVLNRYQEQNEIDQELLAVQQAYMNVVQEIQLLDPANPLTSTNIVFAPGVEVQDAGILTDTPDAINSATTALREGLPTFGGYANGCSGISAARVEALEHYPSEQATLEDFQSTELQKEMVALYKDPNIRAEISSEIGNPEAFDFVMDALVTRMESGEYHPFAISDICHTQGKIQIAAMTGVPAFGDFPDPQVLVWSGLVLEDFTQPFGLGPSSQYAFLPASEVHGSMIFLSNKISGTSAEFWGFYELQDDGSFKPAEICAGYFKPVPGQESRDVQQFVYACQPEFLL